MSYATHLLLIQASVDGIEKEIRERLSKVYQAQNERIHELVLKFVLAEVSPGSTFDFETELAEVVRELGRRVVEEVYNMLEADDSEQLPHDLWYEATGYRRLNQKTRNAHVATLFGTIQLWRYGYRYWHRDEKVPTIFPLEIQLGLVRGATPALAEAAARYMAESGATQATVLARLKRQHHVSLGAERLREITAAISQAVDRYREDYQVLEILRLLKEASRSRGKNKPVLAVGRDGISLCEYRLRSFEVATTATVTVYDRKGKRLGTVYLAFAPELGQAQMSVELTRLVRRVLDRWEGPLPRLAYVTDAGRNETNYYRSVLRRMLHPRTDEPLVWYRIFDYYHASQRIWTMASALFPRNQTGARAWALRMCGLFKKPSGPSRVLHSAAALRSRCKCSAANDKEFRKAYNYIRRRTKFMQYAEYKHLQLPIGSGVTEAACKTIYTQRLKLSGMRWTKNGAQTILNLRVALLSGIWDDVYQASLASHHSNDIKVYEPNRLCQPKKAA
jgi:hypothetical protein